MITKTKVWELICRELKEAERSRKMTSTILNKIKDIPQNANPDQST